ncbi:hypothetical protein MIMGU_mgv11b018988mg [Erythranthe guttata]|uniref:S-protein homolog n=1 Tax=Erythranthe guttata TaxID=4155 RepID=A0A022RCH7_ERYGU|nr:hypothetical protein MIMGU_mgv11b018988mg [Erythranthe guttata]
MLLHCQSRDDRLGYHTLAKDERFDFTFCPVWRTVFFCHVWWNGKDIAFDVYRWKRPPTYIYIISNDCSPSKDCGPLDIQLIVSPWRGTPSIPNASRKLPLESGVLDFRGFVC